MTADDHWWHISAGRVIVDQQAIADHDQFSFTHSGAPWVNSEWLYDVVLAFLWDTFGAWGVFLLRSLLVFGVLMASYFAQSRVWASRSSFASGKVPPVLFFPLFLLMIIQPRIADRPHLAAYFCIALLVYLVPRIFDDRKWYSFLIAGVLLVFWRNIHPSWIVGAALLGAAVADQLYGTFFVEKRGMFRADAGMVLGALLVVAAGFFISPHRFDLSLYTTHMAETGLIAEWDPFWTAFSITPPFIGYLIFIALAIGGAFLTIARRPFTVALSAIFLVQAFFRFRFMPEFVLMSHLIALQPLVRIAAQRKDITAWAGRISFAPWMVFMLLPLVANHYYLGRTLGVGVDRRANPVGVADMMDRYDIGGTLIANDLPQHAYILFRRWPSVKIFIDGRVPPLYPESFLKEYYGLDMRDAVDRYPIDMILWQGALFEPGPAQLFDLLSDTFLLAYYDETTMLLVRKEMRERSPGMPVFRLLVPWRLSRPEYLDAIAVSGYREELFREYEKLRELSDDHLVTLIGREIGYPLLGTH